jgi:hypothetical protein
MSTPEQAGHQQPSQTSTYSHTSEYSQSEATGVAHSTHADIVSFLAVASACAIDIIPYTWLPHLESIGEGYSSSIRQSIANLTTSFAFKPFRRDPLSLSPVQKAFEEATAEIQVLGLPRIRRHPNITRLEGVCWSVSGEGDVLPVIVFEKAGLSSLSNFMQQGQTDVDVDVTHIRLSLAADIVSGLSELHSCRKSVTHPHLSPLSKSRDYTWRSETRQHSCVRVHGRPTDSENHGFRFFRLRYRYRACGTQGRNENLARPRLAPSRLLGSHASQRSRHVLAWVAPTLVVLP